MVISATTLQGGQSSEDEQKMNRRWTEDSSGWNA